LSTFNIPVIHVMRVSVAATLRWSGAY